MLEGAAAPPLYSRELVRGTSRLCRDFFKVNQVQVQILKLGQEVEMRSRLLDQGISSVKPTEAMRLSRSRSSNLATGQSSAPLESDALSPRNYINGIQHQGVRKQYTNSCYTTSSSSCFHFQYLPSHYRHKSNDASPKHHPMPNTTSQQQPTQTASAQ